MDVQTIFDNFISYGFETDDELTDERKLEALNEAYWDVCSRFSWPFLEDSATITYAGDGVDVTGISPPTDVSVVKTVVRSDGAILTPWRRDDFLENFASILTQGGSPALYYQEADQIKVWPVPSSGDSIIVQYIRFPAALEQTDVEAAIAIPPRYHRSVLVKGALVELAILQDDPDTAQVYKAEFEEAIARMSSDLLSQQDQRPDYIHVNDPDNYDYS
jgi:hypothetical protein